MCRMTEQTEKMRKGGGGVLLLVPVNLIRISSSSFFPGNAPISSYPAPLAPLTVCQSLWAGSCIPIPQLYKASRFILFFSPCFVQRMNEGESQVASQLTDSQTQPWSVLFCRRGALSLTAWMCVSQAEVKLHWLHPPTFLLCGVQSPTPESAGAATPAPG